MVGAPTTTIVPFSNTKVLPSCAAACIPLYDANGACVPPAANVGAGATAYTSCFCADPRVTAFSTAATGVCNTACPSAGLSSIATWFQSICSVNQKDSNNNNNNNNNNDGSDDSSTSSTAVPAAKSGGGGDWLSNHWQWVIMLVILVVAIVGIWVGACIWRRRYLRKKDRQFSLGQKHSGSASRPSWGPGVGPGSEAPSDVPPAGYDSQRNSHAMLTGNTAPAAIPEKAPKPKDKKRWIVKDRT